MKCAVLHNAGDFEVGIGQCKSRKLKSRRHGTTDQRPTCGRAGGLPMVGLNDVLGQLASGQIGPKDVFDRRASVGGGCRQDQGGARVKMPDLGGIDMMPMAVFP